MSNIIVHSVSVFGDGGIGDLIYFLHWMKLFTKHYHGDSEQRVVIFAQHPEVVAAFLWYQQEAEPDHPIFKYLNTTTDNIVPQVILNKNAGAFLPFVDAYGTRISLPFMFPETNFNNNHVSVFYISLRCYHLVKNQPLTKFKPVDFERTIGELDLFKANDADSKGLNAASFGLGEHDLGLLHECDKIFDTKYNAELLAKLSKELKNIIFKNESIDVQGLSDFFANQPVVFGYLQSKVNTHILHAILMSPLLQTAIAKGKQPVFVITQIPCEERLPMSVNAAIKMGQIRFVSTWLPKTEHQILSDLFHANGSLIVPSGDNTLMLCLKTGNFPLYAHKKFLPTSESADFKSGIFRDMANILIKLAAANPSLKSNPGFRPCLTLLIHLGKRHISNKSLSIIEQDQLSTAHYEELKNFITLDMLKLFREVLAPYLMLHYNFETKTMPDLLADLVRHQPKARSAPALR